MDSLDDLLAWGDALEDLLAGAGLLHAFDELAGLGFTQARHDLQGVLGLEHLVALRLVVPDIAASARVSKRLIQSVDLYDVRSAFAMERLWKNLRAIRSGRKLSLDPEKNDLAQFKGFGNIKSCLHRCSVLVQRLLGLKSTLWAAQ